MGAIVKTSTQEIAEIAGFGGFHAQGWCYDRRMMQQGDDFRVIRKVAFADTDASGRAHFTAILRYVEEAEHAFFAARGVAVIGDQHGWPRVHVDCDYRAPLAFGDEVEVLIVVQVVGKTSIKYTFTAKKGEQVCAEGSMVIVRVES